MLEEVIHIKIFNLQMSSYMCVSKNQTASIFSVQNITKNYDVDNYNMLHDVLNKLEVVTSIFKIGRE